MFEAPPHGGFVNIPLAKTNHMALCTVTVHTTLGVVRKKKIFVTQPSNLLHSLRFCTKEPFSPLKKPQNHWLG